MRWFRAFLVLPLMLAAAPGHAVDPAAPATLASLEPGLWDLRSRDSNEPAQHLCIRDFQTLIQIRHPGQACRHFVVEDTGERTSVTYTCPRTGHGQTVIRMETPRLVQINSQGVADGYPFAVDFEARRAGACPPVAAARK